MKDELLLAIPKLRALAITLCGRSALSEDLVQETLVKAWAHKDKFEPGTNLIAWLYTILRNEFYSQFRKRRREVADPEGQLAARLATRPNQEARMHFHDFRAAFDSLSPDQREALILVGASGMSYEDAATMCSCAVGTMKSRVSRARARLADLLSLGDGTVGDDQVRWDASMDASQRIGVPGFSDA
jgi:RNA polymerase sigma-70 factor (ECF subfamily)